MPGIMKTLSSFCPSWELCFACIPEFDLVAREFHVLQSSSASQKMYDECLSENSSWACRRRIRDEPQEWIGGESGGPLPVSPSMACQLLDIPRPISQ